MPKTRKSNYRKSAKAPIKAKRKTKDTSTPDLFTPAPTTKPFSSYDVSAKALMVSVHISAWSGRRYDRDISDEVTEDHHADADAGRWNKLLVPGAAINAVTAVATRARKEHAKLTKPWGDDGARLLPTALYVRYMNSMREIQADFNAAVDKFAGAYPNYVEQARNRMGSTFKGDDYPTVERIRNKFAFDYRNFTPVPDANDFRVNLSKDQVEGIKNEYEAQARNVLQEAMKDTITQIVSTVGNMATKLRNYTPKTETTKAEGVFKESLVDNVRELATLLPAFNLTNDPNMTKLAEEIEQALCGTDAKTLREEDDAREDVAKKAEEILRKVKEFWPE